MELSLKEDFSSHTSHDTGLGNKSCSIVLDGRFKGWRFITNYFFTSDNDVLIGVYGCITLENDKDVYIEKNKLKLFRVGDTVLTLNAEIVVIEDIVLNDNLICIIDRETHRSIPLKYIKRDITNKELVLKVVNPVIR